jgi:hypothetical protein
MADRAVHRFRANDPWIALLVLVPLPGGDTTEESKLVAVHAAAYDLFGNSVAVSGDTAVVGAVSDDHAGGDEAGSARVLVRAGSTWMEQAELVAPDAGARDGFGSSAAIWGDTVVVGAQWDDHAGGLDAGSAYVFVRAGTTWSLQAKLTDSEAGAGDGFGASVSIWGDTVVVGAPTDNQIFADRGSVHVFVRTGSTWSEQAKLLAADGAAHDWLGGHVSVSNDILIAGADGDDRGAAANAGSAYVFARDGTSWSLEAKLLASDFAAGDHFGASVSVYGDTAVVGSVLDTWYFGGGTQAGSAYVFHRDGTNWSEQARLRASDADMFDHFGVSVAVSGDTAVVGAEGDSGAGFLGGSAYVFARSGVIWTEQAKLVASDAAAGDRFGASVALWSDTAIVGSSLDDHAAGIDAGSAYVYHVPGSIGTRYCAAHANSTGAPAELVASGSASVAASALVLTAVPVPDRPGLFFHGASRVQAPFGCSFLCATGDIRRGTFVNGEGSIATYVYDDSDVQHSLSAFVSQVRNFQYWFLDPAGSDACTSGERFNTSNAVSIAILP